MNILLLGAAGFIGTNLTMKLAENRQDIITLVDRDISYFAPVQTKGFINIKYVKPTPITTVATPFFKLIARKIITAACAANPANANNNLNKI